jgi:hypothetical protein
MPELPRIRIGFPKLTKPNASDAGSTAANTGSTGKPASAKPPANLPTIEPRWRTALSYSFERDAHDQGYSLTDMPKGWPGSGNGVAKAPRRIESVPRQMGEDLIEDVTPRRKTELGHYLAEFGPREVQTHLSVKPIQTRKPSAGEQLVMEDFAASVNQSTRLSHGKRGPLHGEFIATYTRKTDPDTGALTVERTSFQFKAADSIDVPDTQVKPDYIIHSHPCDPKDPKAASVFDPLGSNYPSGQDRLMARRGTDIPEGSGNPHTELLMHGTEFFHTHGHDLHFSRLDPGAQAVVTHADPDGRDARAENLFTHSHPTPDEVFRKPARPRNPES